MASNFTPADIEILEQELKDLESDLAASKITGKRLAETVEETKKKEAVFKKDFNFFDQIIRNYEKEVEIINGTYVSNPLRESDLLDHINNTGRLYQAPVSFDPKRIQEMVGGGLSDNPRTTTEINIFPKVQRPIDVLLTGLGPNTGVSSTLASPFAPGDASISTEDPIVSGQYYLINGRNLVRIGAPSAGGFCSDNQYDNETDCTNNSETWTTTSGAAITDRLDFANAEEAAPIGASVEVFNGFDSSERLTNTTSDPLQQDFYNMVRAELISQIQSWVLFPQRILTYQIKLERDDPDFDVSDKIMTEELISFIQAYASSSYPLQDGTPGIGELQSEIDDRLSYLPNRVNVAINQKSAYYAARIQTINLRANREEGTLARADFVEDLAGDFPPEGDPNLINKIRRIKRRLADA